MALTPVKPEQGPRRKAEPELKLPRKPEPEIKRPAGPAKPEVGDDQGDSGPDKENPITQDSAKRAHLDPDDAHLGGTENRVSDTPAPSGEHYKDEPRQG